MVCSCRTWCRWYSVVLDDQKLVIANHQSTADIPMMLAIFNHKPGILPNIMLIIV